MSDLNDISVLPEGEQNESEAQNSSKQVNELAKLHRECAKYRTALNSSNSEKQELQKLVEDYKQQISDITKQNNEQKILQKLEAKGCLKPNLVLNDIPAECENIDEFLKDYAQNNPFLFKKTVSRHGFNFSGAKASNYTTSQQMNNYIRSALGR